MLKSLVVLALTMVVAVCAQEGAQLDTPGADGAVIYKGTIPVNVAKVFNVRAYPDYFWGAQRYHHFVASSGSVLEFNFPVSHDIYYMNTQAAFEACDFRNAAKLADGDARNNVAVSDDVNKANKYTFLLNSPGMNYFACSYNGDCQNGNQKLSVEVRGGVVSCSDGVMNQGETGIDCGDVCNVSCVNCNDNQLNGDETGIDCGGSCNSPCVSTCPTSVSEAFQRCRTRTNKDNCESAIYPDGSLVHCSWCNDNDPDKVGCTFNVVCRNPGATPPYAIEAEEDKCIGKVGSTNWHAGLSKSGFLDDPFGTDGEKTGEVVGSDGPGTASITFDDTGYPEGTIFRLRAIPGNAQNEGTSSPLTLRGLSEEKIKKKEYQFKVSVKGQRAASGVGDADSMAATGNGSAGQDDTIIIVLIVVGVVFVCVVAGLGAQYVLRGSSSKGGGSSRAKERFDLGTSPVKV